jgi:hypothetical protein
MRWEYLLLLISFYSLGQQQLEAKYTQEKITIDGIFNETAWSAQTDFAPFIQIKPEPGKPSKSLTRVQLL